MAGIQLTGADESLLDMSGAMPTATVEEINVPVFIDEYLQQSTPTTSTTTTEATVIFSNGNNNNNYSSNGNDFCLKDDEEFEFDIDMIADSTGTEVLETLYYDNSNNNNSSSNSYCNSNSNDIYNTTATNCNEMNINNTVKFEDLNEMFHLLPSFSDDDETMDAAILSGNEDAVDLNPISNESIALFNSMLISSQRDPFISDTIPPSTNNSQTLTLSEHEPVVYDCDSNDITKYDSSTMDNIIQPEDGSFVKEEIEQQDENQCKKLYLNVSASVSAMNEDPHTPDIIELLSQCNVINTPVGRTVEQIKAELSEIDFDSIIYDEEPSTPQSFTSSYTHPTTHTECTTSPNSPALSIISIDTTNRKKRGRPSKQHSDPLPIEKLQTLTPTERKRLEDRVKNNEASRVSRQKNKKREEDEIKEESELLKTNLMLKAELAKLDHIHEKYRKHLFRSHKKS